MAIRIYIDEGHNPTGHHNGGAVGNLLIEQDVNLQVGNYLAMLLDDDPRFSVRQSRPNGSVVLGSDNSSSLAARVTAANAWPADYFVSIHCNSNVNSAIHGSEVYVYKENTQSYWLAQHILNAMVKEAGTKDNGVRINPSLYVLRKSNMPAVLVELAYLSNSGDAEKLKNDPRAFAWGIYNGILSYFGFPTLL